MAIELNKQALMQMGNKAVKVGTHLSQNSPEGSFAQGLGEFLKNLPTMLVKTESMIKDVKDIKMMEKGNNLNNKVHNAQTVDKGEVEAGEVHTPLTDDMPSPQVNQFDPVILRGKIEVQLKSVFDEAKKNEEMLKSMDAYTLVQIFESKQEDIINKLMGEISKYVS